MNRQTTTMIAGLLLATSAAASQESSHYESYFSPVSVQQLITQTELYNEENGYWDRSNIMNVELVRYLNTLEKKTLKAADSSAEAQSYWQ